MLGLWSAFNAVAAWAAEMPAGASLPPAEVVAAAVLSPVLATIGCLLVYRLARARGGGLRAVAAAILVWWLAAVLNAVAAVFVLLLTREAGRVLAVTFSFAAQAAITSGAVGLAMRVCGRARRNEASPPEDAATSGHSQGQD